MTLRRAFPAVTTSVTEARRWVASHLHTWQLDDLVDDASVLVSELVSNAVSHAGSAAEVTLDRDVDLDLVRVSVADTGPGEPAANYARPDSMGGRGLRIVEALADDWGVERSVGGKRVWFELSTARG